MPKLVLGLLISCAVAGGDLRAACDFPLQPEPGNDLHAEIARIRAHLEGCEGPSETLRQRFFTWGHGDKLDFLLEHPPAEACAYDRERAYTRAEISLTRAAELQMQGRTAAARKRVRRVARRIVERSPLGLREISSLRRQDVQTEDLSDDEFRVAVTLGKYLFAAPHMERWFGENGTDLATRIQTREDQILRLLDESSRKLRRKSEILPRPLSPVEKARLKGELVGLKIAARPDDKLNSDSFGSGVYWSTNPLDWLSHFYTFDHAGMVCDFRGGAPPSLAVTDLTDLDDIARLREVEILVPDATTREWTLAGYNNFMHPTAFDTATHRSFFVWRSGVRRLYLDRCAIDYGGELCHDFVVTDLTCAQARQLEGDAVLLKMQPYFERTDPYWEELYDLNDGCEGEWIDLYRFAEPEIDED